MPMQTGYVKWFNEKKGYGFLVCQEGTPEGEEENKDIFVHYKDIENEESFKTLEQGAKVTFEIVKGPKGLKAQSVTLVNE